ncbi:hypothetical protein STAFG_4285 [Streptomyces afghaniensis 772]|uniref:Uncharacterized protein n=1 Tax=Streptomyces afghaniensis 772 TaxID=1283301 RepID=S4MXN7_9ACTN|nr:hypothetical protein STAFG_4285 [Streptomyces afghaniensis 772]
MPCLVEPALVVAGVGHLAQGVDQVLVVALQAAGDLQRLLGERDGLGDLADLAQQEREGLRHAQDVHVLLAGGGEPGAPGLAGEVGGAFVVAPEVQEPDGVVDEVAHIGVGAGHRLRGEDVREQRLVGAPLQRRAVGAGLGGREQLVGGVTHPRALFAAQLGQEHGLEQTVHLEGVRPRVDLDQGELAEVTDGAVQFDRLAQQGVDLGRDADAPAAAQHGPRDGLGRHAGADVEQLPGAGVVLLDALQRDVPGSRDGDRVVGVRVEFEDLRAALGQQVEVLVDLHARDGPPGARLLHRERQVAQGLGEPVGVLGGQVGGTLLEQFDRLLPLEDVHRQRCGHPFPGAVPGGDDDLPGAVGGEVGAYRLDVLGVVEDEQPVVVRGSGAQRFEHGGHGGVGRGGAQAVLTGRSDAQLGRELGEGGQDEALAFGGDPADHLVVVLVGVDVLQRQLGLSDPAQPVQRMRQHRRRVLRPQLFLHGPQQRLPADERGVPQRHVHQEGGRFGRGGRHGGLSLRGILWGGVGYQGWHGRFSSFVGAVRRWQTSRSVGQFPRSRAVHLRGCSTGHSRTHSIGGTGPAGPGESGLDTAGPLGVRPRERPHHGELAPRPAPLGRVGQRGAHRIAQGGAQRDTPGARGGQFAHHADGVGELAAGGGGEQFLADTVGELGVPLAAAVPVDQPAHQDLGEVVRAGLRHGAPPQLFHEVELEGNGGELGGEPARCRGGEREEAAHGGLRGAREAGGAQAGRGRPLGEGAGQDDRQAAAHSALPGDEVGPGGEGTGLQGEHRHGHGAVARLGQRSQGVGAAGRRPVFEAVVGGAESAGLQDGRVGVERGAVTQMRRQQMHQGRGACVGEPAEQVVGGGRGPPVGESVGDHEEDAVATPVEEFGGVGGRPGGGPAQGSCPGARHVHPDRAHGPEGAAVLGGLGETGGGLLPDPQGGRVVDEQDQVEGRRTGGTQEGHPHAVHDSLLGGGLFVELQGVPRGHAAGQLVQRAGEPGGRAPRGLPRAVVGGQQRLPETQGEAALGVG